MTTASSSGSRPGRTAGAANRRRELISLAVLAVAAYLPALRSAPGRMPADSKLYLYLDPGRFLGDAASSFDPRQFAGWVPHQHISYLWPAGPYYWLAGAVGLPDWIAHRLWIGSLLFAAGAGMWWCSRRFGFRGGPVLAGAIVYQWGVYILPYISRTSVMLLPWAGLGWILGLTIQATRQADAPDTPTTDTPTTDTPAPDTPVIDKIRIRVGRWRYPALIALVVFTVGSVNATALAMIIPAPLLWLLYWAGRSPTRWRRVIGISVRTAITCGSVSLWWIVMLEIQGRYGAEVLPFSETLQDVSFTSTAPEVWRGLGYWLFYIRDFAGPTTSASFVYLTSGMAILLSFAVPLIGLCGLALTDWAERRFAWLLVGVGGVLAVGVYPFEQMSPLMRTITGNGHSGLALALRSSTRAVPVLMLGVSLGVAAACESVPRRLGDLTRDGRGRLPTPNAALGRVPLRTIAVVIVSVVALLNVPSARRGQLVDPMLERAEQPPVEWTAAAASLSGPGTTDGRVLQVPGIEFGAYRWGFTVDQPVPGLADKPLVTRDLLPLGSPGAMDVLYALDDRVQAGTVSAAEMQAGARFLGVDTIWLTGDLAFDRFNTARPVDLQATVEALGDVTGYGEPRINTPTISWTDERSLARPQSPIAPVELIKLAEPTKIARAASGLVAVSGSGDGLVAAAPVLEAAAHGAVVYTADRTGDEVAAADALVITDSNRNRNRHWRTSHDSAGATLTATDPVTDVERSQRLPVFENTATDTQTVAVQDGPITAFADRYGEPFGFQPEHRAAMAIDGDPTTAWTIGEHGDPVGATIVIDPSTPVDQLDLTQFLPIPGQRHISRLRISWPDDLTVSLPDPPYGLPGGDLTVDIDGSALDQPTSVTLPAATTMPITIEILAVDGGAPLTEGIVADVGFSEVAASGPEGRLPPTTEWIRTPIDAIASVEDDLPVAYSLHRERVGPLNAWRSDPEPALRRIIAVGARSTFSIDAEARVDAAIDDRALADLLGGDAWATSRLRGSLANWGAAAYDGDPETAWISAFDQALGSSLTLRQIDEPVATVTITQPDPDLSQITAVDVTTGQGSQRIAVDADSNGVTRLALDPPLPPGPLSITIAEIDAKNTIDRRFGDVRQLPAAISEVTVDGVAGSRAPATAADATTAASTSSTTECVDLLRIDDTVLRARLTPSPAVLADRTLTVEPCDPTVDGAIALDAGEHRVASVAPDWVQIDAVDLRNEEFTALLATAVAPVAVDASSGSKFDRQIHLTGCDAGCWLVFGEGYNRGWRAAVDGRSLGTATLVDGTSNGWWIPAESTANGAVTVDVTWSQQAPLNWALALSALAVLACIGVAIASRTPGLGDGDRTVAEIGLGWCPPRLPIRSAIIIGAATTVTVGVLVGGGGIWVGVLVALAVIVSRRATPLLLAPPVLVLITAVVVIRGEIDHRYTPDALWPRQFDGINSVAMAAFALAVVAGLSPLGKRERSADGG